MDYPPYFIADIAANHDGDILRAYKLIELAKESGADAAKFQNFKANKIVSKNGFEKLGTQLAHQKSWKKSVYEIYEEASLSDDWSYLLKCKCHELGIEYMTSPYDFDSVDLADKYVNAFKIGSGDISWLNIIKYIAQKEKPVLLACGASSMQEVDMAVKTVLDSNPNLILMQCNTNYTATSENMKYINLNVLNTFKQAYPDVILGLSDHTRGASTVLGAIALGARVIEKHFTDDTSRIGPDHAFSTTPDEWKTMVHMSNDLFNALGTGVKQIESNERTTSIVQKRSLYTTRTIRLGEIITEDSLYPLRPRSDVGYEPWEIEELIGKRAKKNICEGILIERKDVE